MLTQLPDRVFNRIMPVTSGCWIWTGSVTDSGYGTIRIDGVVTRAHRVVYELLVGLIPNGLEIDHLCRTKPCVNPDHLEPVTHQENTRRGVWIPKKQCPKGHPYRMENISLSSKGYKVCLTCKRTQSREYARRIKKTSQETSNG